MMQTLRICCAFHQNQYITNFCVCKQCLLPLCPICIKIHTQQHVSMQVNPQYQHITQVINRIQQNIDRDFLKYNNLYRNINNLDNQIQQTKITLKNQLEAYRNNLIKDIQQHFRKSLENIDQHINSLTYVKMLQYYKDTIKKGLYYIKGMQRGIHDRSKLMRIIIKYKSQNIKQYLNRFSQQTDHYLNKMNHNLFKLVIPQNYKQLISNFYGNTYKLQLNDISNIDKPIDVLKRLKQIIIKQPQKKQIRKSIQNILQKNSIDCSFTQKDDSIDCRRRSLSKGKGLTVLQHLNNLGNSNIKKQLKAAKICDQSFQGSYFSNKISYGNSIIRENHHR